MDRRIQTEEYDSCYFTVGYVKIVFEHGFRFRVGLLMALDCSLLELQPRHWHDTQRRLVETSWVREEGGPEDLVSLAKMFNRGFELVYRYVRLDE